MAPSAAPPALSQQPQQEAQQPLHPFLLVWRCLPASLMDPAMVPLLVSLVQDKCVPDVQVPAQLGTTPLFSSSNIWIENITTPTNPYSAQMLSWWVSILLSYTGCISHRSQQMADIALVCSSNAADKPSHFSSTWAWGLSDVTWIKKLFFQKSIVQEQGSLNFQNYLTFKQKNPSIFSKVEIILLPCIWSKEEFHCLIPNSMKAGWAVQSFHLGVADVLHILNVAC